MSRSDPSPTGRAGRAGLGPGFGPDFEKNVSGRAEPRELSKKKRNEKKRKKKKEKRQRKKKSREKEKRKEEKKKKKENQSPESE